MSRKLRYFTRLAMVFLFQCPLSAQTPSPSPALPEGEVVEIQSVDPTILIDLKYATADNITDQILYPSEFKAQLRRGVALELKKAQEALRSLGYGLKVWDAYRPMEVQKALYAVMSDSRFVAEPGVRSMHNRAVAVDVTLVDATGGEVAMPTKFDVMSPSAFYIYRGENPVVQKNLQVLQRVMKENGFYACRTEWWHFFSRRWKQFPNVAEPSYSKKSLHEKHDQL